MLQQMNKKLCVELHNIVVLKSLYGIRAEKSLTSIHPFYYPSTASCKWQLRLYLPPIQHTHPLS
jgi:hypothetical protein